MEEFKMETLFSSVWGNMYEQSLTDLQSDIEIMTNRILTGWQITENKLSEEMIRQVAIHEIGHALVSIFTNYKKILLALDNYGLPFTYEGIIKFYR